MSPSSRIMLPQAIGTIPNQTRLEGTSSMTFELRVQNDGNASGFARIEVTTQTSGPVTNGPTIEVPAGFDVQLIAQHPIGSLPPGTYTVDLVVREMDSDGVTPLGAIDQSSFTLTVEGVAPQLSAASGWSFSPAISSGIVTIEEGQTLNVSISCRNDGNADGIAQVVTLVPQVFTDTGATRTIAPGSTNSVTNATVINLSPGDYSAFVELRDVTDGAPGTLIDDLFFILRVTSSSPNLLLGSWQAPGDGTIRPDGVSNLVASIDITNQGNTDATAQVSVDNISTGVVRALSNRQTIPAGQTVRFDVNYAEDWSTVFNAGRPLRLSNNTLQAVVELVNSDGSLGDILDISNQYSRYVEAHEFSITQNQMDLNGLLTNYTSTEPPGTRNWPADTGTNARARCAGSYRGSGGALFNAAQFPQDPATSTVRQSPQLTLSPTTSFVSFSLATDILSWLANTFSPGDTALSWHELVIISQGNNLTVDNTSAIMTDVTFGFDLNTGFDQELFIQFT